MGEVTSTKKIKAKVVGAGTFADPFRVNLPAYMMIPGTEEYAGPEEKVLRSVEVLVPADELDDQGRLDKAKIRAKYKDNPKWDHSKVTDDV